MWKDFFFFPATDKRAILILSALLLTGIAILWLKPESPIGEIDKQIADSLLLAATTKGKDVQKEENISPTYRPFNPNTADSVTMVKAGVPKFVARNIVRYRKAGGHFRNPEQLARIYGMTEEVYNELFPYISIPAEKREKKEQSEKEETKSYTTDTARLSATKYPPSVKYPEGTTIELNDADTTELKKIPGIGSWRARRIVEYRQRLGGFYDIAQLKEIEGLPENIGKWFTLRTSVQTRLNINKESIGQLQKHPYLNFYQARCIVEYRRKHGSIINLKQLSLCKEFTADDLKRLEPYVVF